MDPIPEAEAQSAATSPYFINCDSSTFFNSNAASIDIDSSGNIYFVSGGGGIGKIDSSCNVQWKINVDTAPIDSARGVSIDNSGNIFILNNPHSNDNVQILKFDSSGNFISTFAQLPDRWVDFDSLDVSNNGNVYVVTQGYYDGNNRNHILHVFDSSGNLLYEKEKFF